MRYVLVAIFVCAVGAPAASALPTVSPDRLSLSQAEPVAQRVKRGRPQARHARAKAPAPAASILWSAAATTDAEKKGRRFKSRRAVRLGHSGKALIECCYFKKRARLA